MDTAAAALADLVEISSQVEAAVLIGPDGAVAASTLADETRSARFAEAAKCLFDAAVANESEIGSPPLQQLEAATVEGSVFVARDGDRLIAAVTGPEPTVGLVFYDLKAALRQVGQADQSDPPAEAAPKPRRARKKAEDATAPETQPDTEPKIEPEIEPETQHAAP